LTDVAASGLPAIALVAIVGSLAVVQSLFGVGLLLFGTPVLLLSGMSYDHVLVYLLPCSIVVSVLQVASSGGLTLEPIRRQFLLFTVPAVLAATAVAVRYGSPHQIRAIVGVMLLVTAAVRLGPMQAALSRVVRRHRQPLMFGLGAVHGISNLGGGILTVIVGSSFDDKLSIRRHIAFAYGTMAMIQLAVVLLVKHPYLDVRIWLLLPAVAAATYLLVGQRAFRATRPRTFEFGLTGVIAVFGALLVGAV
jgi:uncharacterized protein